MTRRITIAGIIFNVEPLGYEMLKAYKEALKQWNPQHKEQWEEQAAEHLLQQLNRDVSVTTLDHVEGIGKRSWCTTKTPKLPEYQNHQNQHYQNR